MKYAVLTKKLDELNVGDFDEEVLNQYENLTLRKEGLSYTVDGQEIITTIDNLIQDMCNKQIELIFDAFAERVAQKMHETVEPSQNCVKCKHYCETEDDTGVHSQCRATCSDNAQVDHWIKHSDTAYECPICGRGIDVGLPKYIDVERYCRYCGARLIP